MSDPKYSFKDGDLIHEDGYTVPRDEPLMIFRGKDIGALSAIVDYIEMLEDQIPMTPTIVSHIASASERLVAFYLYQYNNKHLQSVGCSQRSHTDSIYFMKRAKAKIEELNIDLNEKHGDKDE